MPTITATFHDRQRADQAIDDLIAHGVSPNHISALMSKETRERIVASPPDEPTDITRAAGAGAVLGGGLGALAGGLFLGGLTVATAGAAAPFVIVGPLVGAMIGGVSGVGFGGLFGGLAAAGVDASKIDDLAKHAEAGAVVVAVRTTDDAEHDIRTILDVDRLHR
jgi:hypothetical protein